MVSTLSLSSRKGKTSLNLWCKRHFVASSQLSCSQTAGGNADPDLTAGPAETHAKVFVITCKVSRQDPTQTAGFACCNTRLL